MGQTDKQFGGFLRLVIAQLKKAIAAQDIETMRKMMQELLDDLQNTLEDWVIGGCKTPPYPQGNNE